MQNHTLPEANIASENQWLEDENSSWDGLFLGAMFVSGRVTSVFRTVRFSSPPNPLHSEVCIAIYCLKVGLSQIEWAVSPKMSKKNQPGRVRFVWWGFLSGKGELRLVVHPRFFQGITMFYTSKWCLFQISEPATVHLPTFFITFHVTQTPSRGERNRSRVRDPNGYWDADWALGKGETIATKSFWH